MGRDWSDHTSWSEVCQRAGGRRHYNSVRAFQMKHRRKQVADLLLTTSGRGLIGQHGVQAHIARLLGVSEATISRDCAFLHQVWLGRISDMED